MGRKDDLQALNERYMSDERFQHFRDLHKNFVPGAGPLKPKLMLIGEAPGRMENAKRMPFVGQAGINLTNLLEDVGIDSYDVFMTNVVKYWPPHREGGYTPTEDEIIASREYLEEEIEIVEPVIIGLCGRTSIHAMFPEVGNVHDFHGQLLQTRFVPLYHPAMISYQPHRKMTVREGYTKLKAYLDAKAVV